MAARNHGGTTLVSRWPKVEGSGEVHVLAVDDCLVDRKIIERLLKISSCKVTAVDSGRRALQFLGLDEEKNSSVGFKSLKVDMIITDYCMPGMTGYELLKKIKGSSTLREIPVVIMSSENESARMCSCLEEGAEEFIVKPVKLADVKRLKDYMVGEEWCREKRKLVEETSMVVPPITEAAQSSENSWASIVMWAIVVVVVAAVVVRFSYHENDQS